MCPAHTDLPDPDQPVNHETLHQAETHGPVVVVPAITAMSPAMDGRIAPDPALECRGFAQCVIDTVLSRRPVVELSVGQDLLEHRALDEAFAGLAAARVRVVRASPSSLECMGPFDVLDVETAMTFKPSSPDLLSAIKAALGLLRHDVADEKGRLLVVDDAHTAPLKLLDELCAMDGLEARGGKTVALQLAFVTTHSLVPALRAGGYTTALERILSPQRTAMPPIQPAVQPTAAADTMQPLPRPSTTSLPEAKGTAMSGLVHAAQADQVTHDGFVHSSAGQAQAWTGTSSRGAWPSPDDEFDEAEQSSHTYGDTMPEPANHPLDAPVHPRLPAHNTQADRGGWSGMAIVATFFVLTLGVSAAGMAALTSQYGAPARAWLDTSPAMHPYVARLDALAWTAPSMSVPVHSDKVALSPASTVDRADQAPGDIAQPVQGLRAQNTGDVNPLPPPTLSPLPPAGQPAGLEASTQVATLQPRAPVVENAAVGMGNQDTTPLPGLPALPALPVASDLAAAPVACVLPPRASSLGGVAIPAAVLPPVPEAPPEPPAGSHVVGDPRLAGPALARGNATLALHDVATARRYYRLAADAGSADAALALGKTYDPGFVAHPDSFGVKADVSTAAQWYRRAAALGSPVAQGLLHKLGYTDPAP